MNWHSVIKSPLLVLLLLTLLWSPGFSMFKVAVEELSPLTIITLRALLSGLILWGILKYHHMSLDLSFENIKHSFTFSLIGISIPSYILAYSVIYIDSMVSAMAFALSPIGTVIIAHFYLKDEPLNKMKGLGLFMGFIGANLLLVPTLIDGTISHDSFSIILCLLSSFLYSLSILYVKKNMQSVPSLVSLTSSYISSCLYLIPLWLLIDQPWTMKMPSSNALMAVAGIIICSVLGFSTYFYLLKISIATLVSMINYLMPIASSFFGVFMLGEPITIFFILSSSFIFSGIYLIRRYS